MSQTVRSLLLLLHVVVGSCLLACGKAPKAAEVSYITINGVECLEGTAACGADCAHLDSSAEHCGSCDNACSLVEVCNLGRCRPRTLGCASERLLCASDCVDSLSDRAHCGSCDERCPAEAACEEGACACSGGLALCDQSCVDTSSDDQHCGSCDGKCISTQSCNAGRCECPAGSELCAQATVTLTDSSVTSGAARGACVDTSTDSTNCGSCGLACRGGKVCQAGSCACPGAGIFCAERCVDPTRDSQNCGACANVCGGGQICSGGACACPSGQTLCDGQCTNTQSDTNHCGGCGSICPLGEGCGEGRCQSGALGEDGCQGLVRGLSISQVSAYQTVESVIARGGTSVTDPEPAVVAGRPMLLRAFVAPQPDWVQREVSARLFISGGTSGKLLYSRSTLSPAAASQLTVRNSTLEFLVPAADVTPDTRFALELVECGGPVTGAVADARFPATSVAELGAIDTGGLRIHIVPLRANGLLPDTSAAALDLYRSVFLDTYPISSVELSVGAPLTIVDPEDWAFNIDSLRALRQSENAPAEVYYYGLLRPANTFDAFCGNSCIAGIGYVARGAQAADSRAAMGLAFADVRSALIMLHEVGHNHGRSHAPCVPPGLTIDDIDADYPQADGSTGGLGYNALGDELLAASLTDLMGYCTNQWLSPYTYAGLLDSVLAVNRVQASEVPNPARMGSWAVLLVDSAHGARWGKPVPGASVAMGEEEAALVLDAAGAPVQSVSVFRTRLSELDAASIQVPQRRPGWAAIQLAGAAPVAFPGPR